MRFNPDKPNDCKFCNIASAIGPLIGGAMSLFGGSQAADAAEDAAGVQAQSAREAIALGREGLGFQQEMFDTSRADLAPWRDSGTAALGTMNNMFLPGGQPGVQLQGRLNDLRAQRAVLARTGDQAAPPVQQAAQTPLTSIAQAEADPMTLYRAPGLSYGQRQDIRRNNSTVWAQTHR